MKLNTCIIFAILIFSSVHASAAKDDKGCSTFAHLSSDAAKFWQNPSPQIVTVTSELSLSPSIKTGSRADLTLLESSLFKMVSEVSAQHRSSSDQKSYGGMVRFQATLKGDYSIAAKAGVWIEVIDLATNKAIESSHHEMQAGCDLFHKVVSFPLAANHNYGLQLSGSKSATTSLLIVKAP